MSDLLESIDNSPVGVYPTWTRLGEYGMPKVDPAESMKQPDKIKITYTMNGRRDPDKNHISSGNYSAVPDKGELGCEYLVHFTLPGLIDIFQGFVSTVDHAHNHEYEEFGKQMFAITPECLQGDALTTWQAVCSDNNFNEEANKTKANWKIAVQLYLEQIQAVRYIGNFILRWLASAKKPAHMKSQKWVARRNQLYHYVTDGYFRVTISQPNEQERAEQYFLSHPKAHQQRYARDNNEVKNDISELTNFFHQCHEADKKDGTYEKLMVNLKKSADNRKRKAEGADALLFEKRGGN